MLPKVDPMSSTTFAPVFRVGASVTLMKRLTPGLRARAGRRYPGRGRCAPPVPKKCGWSGPPVLSKIEIGGAAVVERLMRPLGVIEREIVSNPVAGIAWRAIVGQVDLLIFQAAPQALGKDVIQGPPLAIHTDLDTRRFERLGDLRTGEMTTLIRVPNLREGLCPRASDRREHKTYFQALVEHPTDHVAAEPVDNR